MAENRYLRTVWRRPFGKLRAGLPAMSKQTPRVNLGAKQKPPNKFGGAKYEFTSSKLEL